MTQAETATELRFDPPGPGSWKLDAVHFPRPVTRYWVETHPEPFRRGFGDFTRFYGMLIDSLDTAYPQGFSYTMMRPVSPEEVPSRIARAEEVFRNRLWREQLREWDDVVRPASIAAHREVQSVDPDALESDELAAYLTRCHEHHAAMIAQHMRFTAAAMIPTGDFLAHVGAWTGLPSSDLLGLLRGAAPVSAGASGELDRLVSAIAADDQARGLLEESDTDAALTLERLRGLEGDTGAAVNGYLDLVGWRLLDGFDISGPCALELPDVLLRAIRIAVAGRDAGTSNVEELIAGVREKVPAEHRDEFDELLGGGAPDLSRKGRAGRLQRHLGIRPDAARRARGRAAARGRRTDQRPRASHRCERAGDARRSWQAPRSRRAEELAMRAEYRATHTAKDAPPFLGDPPSPPPDPSGLPPAAARVMGAMGIAMGEMFGSSEEEHEEHVLRGLAASRGRV